ncbi:hypothetical protein YSA_09983 [Pseudomonas putida ND6]|uniref:Uncharacterized protein n=1 Tax=Pseudomonas putida ND6 TaxID=231023 RepID=I3V369_PSEPU|nr:hypothetical protein YSA_09983 [Pseudomonas putida ND6]
MKILCWRSSFSAVLSAEKLGRIKGLIPAKHGGPAGQFLPIVHRCRRYRIRG